MKLGQVRIKTFGVVSAVLVLVCAMVPAPTFAKVELPKGRESLWTENNILFYDPEAEACEELETTTSGSYYDPITGEVVPAKGDYSRLKDYVKMYGEIAMDLQRKYGVPWEVVFAQMQHESQMGTAGIGVDTKATNNWLGITGSGDDGSWTSSKGRKWAKFSSVKAAMEAWAGGKVLRAGYYDAAFKYLDPQNYDLDGFLAKMISVYAPASDGNNVSAYVSSVKSLIEGPIKEVREQMGWLSSQELAEQENIGIGGQHPIGSTVDKGPTSNATSGAIKTPDGRIICQDNNGWNKGDKLPDEGNMDIEATALAILNGDMSAYEAILVKLGIKGNVTDCGRFVSAVMRYSGVDPNFPVYTTDIWNYLQRSNSGWGYVNTKSSADLRSGDILIKKGSGDQMGHIKVIVDNNGKLVEAQASHGDHGPELSNGIGSLDGYSIYRKL